MKIQWLFLTCCIASLSVAAETASLLINKEPVCETYLTAYQAMLTAGSVPSFQTKEIPSQKDGTVFTATESLNTSFEFSKPITLESIQWLTWSPLIGVEHSFKWGGTSTNAIAIGSIKPSPSTSLLLQTSTIGWRGPFYSVWLVEDTMLKAIAVYSSAEDIKLGRVGAQPLDADVLQNIMSLSFNNLFKFRDQLYQVSNDAVYQLNGTRFNKVCEMGLPITFESLQLTALVKQANQSLMTEGVTHIPRYYGTIGNPHRFVTDGFTDAIKKPWLIRVAENGACYQSETINNCSKNKRIESVINEYAGRDPWTYRESLVIREHMAGARLTLKQFYINKLKYSESKAEGKAAQAVYDFIAKTVLLHPLLSYDSDDEPASDSYSLDSLNGAIETNWFNKTALMWAAHFNDYDAVKRLLKSRSGLNLVTSSEDEYSSVQQLNRSALTYALENASLPVIQLLLQAGANSELVDSKGNNLSFYLDKNINVDLLFEQVTAAPKANISPSFNCEKAQNKYERAICSSEGLSVYDQQLGSIYKLVRNSNQYPNITRLQRDWLKSTKRQCRVHEGSDLVRCMKKIYRPRIKYLENLMRILPNGALAD